MSADRLADQLWAEVSPDTAPVPVTVTGTRGHLTSRFAADDAAVACVGVALRAAAVFHECRGGPRLAVATDRGHVAAAVRSERYFRWRGRSLGPAFAPLSRFWQAADGWVRTHGNYPWHQAALLRALGCGGGTDQLAAGVGRRPADHVVESGGAAAGLARLPAGEAADDAEAAGDVAAAAEPLPAGEGEDRVATVAARLPAGEVEDRVAAVAGRLPAGEIEDCVVAAGGVAAAVRTLAQWRDHPQGQSLSAEPLVGRAQFGGAAPRHHPAGDLPASGVRVLDLTRVIAGPVGTRMLGALGADVLRLDPPALPDLPPGTPADSLLAKRSAPLDLASEAGAATLHRLLDGADVLVCGYRPGALDRFGLAPSDLAGRHPGLVAVYLSAWGRTGPWAPRRGFDSIVQAAAGIGAGESADGVTPGALPCQLLDHGTGYLAAAAALDGLRCQAEHGGTQARYVSLAATAWWLTSITPPPGRAAPVRRLRPEPWLVTLPAGDGPVQAVSPPGRLGNRPLRWPGGPARYCTDRPEWLPR